MEKKGDFGKHLVSDCDNCKKSKGAGWDSNDGVEVALFLLSSGCHNKYCRLGGLNTFLYSAGGWESEIRVLAWLGSGEGLLLLACTWLLSHVLT